MPYVRAGSIRGRARSGPDSTDIAAAAAAARAVRRETAAAREQGGELPMPEGSFRGEEVLGNDGSCPSAEPQACREPVETPDRAYERLARALRKRGGRRRRANEKSSPEEAPARSEEKAFARATAWVLCSLLVPMTAAFFGEPGSAGWVREGIALVIAVGWATGFPALAFRQAKREAKRLPEKSAGS